MTKTYEFDFRLRSVLNARWHWTKLYRYKRELGAFTAAYWTIHLGNWRPMLPCKVTLTRIAPRAMDSHDNLRASGKSAIDSLAKIIGVDDADPRVTWLYSQERGQPRAYAVRVAIEETHD